MELFFKRRIGERMEGIILPSIINQLNMRTRGLAHMKAKRGANFTAEVTEFDNPMDRPRHVVKLQTHECTCLE